MTTQQHQTFHDLLQVWNAHQDRRNAQEPIAELAASRMALDKARLAAARHLRAAA